MVIRSFIMRQLARLRFFAVSFAFFFTMFNFVNILVLMLANIGVIIEWYWLLVMYAGISLFGLFFTFLLEKSKMWSVDVIQTWKMSQRELADDRLQYQALLMAESFRLNDEEIIDAKKKLEDKWK